MTRKNKMNVMRSDTHVCVVIPKAVASRLALVMDDAGDWIGNIEPEEIGISSKSLAAAEDDLNELVEALR
jgi:hypothetical protein